MATLLYLRNTPNYIRSSPVQRLFSRRTRSLIPVAAKRLVLKVKEVVKDKITLKGISN